MIKGVDVSAYQIGVPWAELVKNAGLAFVIVKGDQMTATDNHMELARQAGVLIVGEYFWDDPTSSASYLVNWFANDIREHNPDFVWLDVEQWWASWTEYFDAIAGKIPWASVTKLSPTVISNHAKAVLVGLQQLFPHLSVGIYSASWFTNQYAPAINDWVGGWPMWWAHYYDLSTGTRNVTWTELAALPPDNFGVIVPPGTVWDIWQFSSTIVTPAQDARYDWNAFSGTLDEMLRWVGKTEVTPMTAGIYKTTVPMAQRAWVMEIKADQKIGAGISTLGTDAVILPMVNTPWDGSHSRVLVEPTFLGRFEEAGSMPVFGKVELDAGLVTSEQHTKPELDGHTVWQNFWIPRILDAWHVGPWTQATLKPADFRPIKALIFEQVTEKDHQTPARDIEDGWQAYIFQYVVDKLRVLMAAGAIPTVPIILKTNGDWLKK